MTKEERGTRMDTDGHGSAGRRARRPAEARGRTVLFPTDILERLQPHALEREISPNELARRIVDTVVDENLIDAVLDDGKDGA